MYALENKLDSLRPAWSGPEDTLMSMSVCDSVLEHVRVRMRMFFCMHGHGEDTYAHEHVRQRA